VSGVSGLTTRLALRWSLTTQLGQACWTIAAALPLALTSSDFPQGFLVASHVLRCAAKRWRGSGTQQACQAGSCRRDGWPQLQLIGSTNNDCSTPVTTICWLASGIFTYNCAANFDPAIAEPGHQQGPPSRFAPSIALESVLSMAWPHLPCTFRAPCSTV
jgi:hypothetical protein